MSDRLARWILVVLLLAGFGLRVHGLGDAGLRLDEAGQAWAATQPTLAGLVAIERTHVMAMPLDYVLTRAMATVNDNEFVLRLPSAAWATLNIAALYALTRLLTGRRTAALLAALLLTVSPLHVGYAQVLRFYASLSTFYALACLLLYRALRRPTGGRWAAFGLVTLIGAYSHPFVPTVAVNGAAYFLLAGPARRENRPALLRFIGVMLVVGALFLPGYLTFGVQHQYDFEPFQFSGSLRTVILSGLDWTTTLGVASAGPAAAVWRWVNAALVALGLAALLRRRQVMALSLPLGAVAIGGLILAGVVLSGYWLLPRQLFHLTQVGIFLAAVGAEEVARALAGRLSGEGRQRAARLALVGALGVGAIAAARPTLQRFYTTPIATGREAAAALLVNYQPGAAAYIIPDYERQSLQYYLDRPTAAPPGIRVQPTTPDELAATAAANDGTIFLALLGGSPEELAHYAGLGFRVLYDNPALGGRRYILLVRDATAP